MTTLRVGAALSQSGIYALQGQQALQGLTLWVEDTNALGGLFVPALHRAAALQLITYDDHSRRRDVEQLTARLITADRVDFLIGPYSSGLASAAAAVAERHQQVLWNHGGSSDAIMRQGWRWSVHLPTPASGYLTGLFCCLRRHGMQTGRVAIVQRQRGTFASEVAAGARQQAGPNGFLPLPSFFYPDEPGQVSTVAAALGAAYPSVLVVVGRFQDDVALIRALAAFPLRAQALAAVAAPMQAFRTELGELADGWLGPSQWEATQRGTTDIGPSTAAFVEHFRQRFGQIPDYPAAQAYAAGLILQHCVSQCGTYIPADLRAAADTLVCRTFYGDFRLEAGTGKQVGHQTLLVQWQAGAKQIIWPGDVAQAPLVYPRR
jgi:branched-chain amino acid transport system substrate-binding protein